METAHRKHPPYLRIWAWLAVLTVAEVGLALELPFSQNMKLLLLLVLAVWKAALVAMYFMHLRFERWGLRIIAIAALPLAAIFVLAAMTEKIW